MSTLSIAGLDKSKVLQALFNASKQQGMGFANPAGASQMNEAEAKEIVDSGVLSYDYLKGRVMKVDISGDDLSVGLFDRDNGQGAAARAIGSIAAEQSAA